MAEFETVPVIEVSKVNFASVCPVIIQDVRAASFIGIDFELSGLGNRKNLNTAHLEERYKNMMKVADNYSVLSIGLSTFCLKDSKERNVDLTHKTNYWDYLVSTYNILVSSSEKYMVEPEAAEFLVQHGFDFNRLFLHGLPYYKGNDREGDQDEYDWHLRDLFTEIIIKKKSLVLHNGTLDLIFLYHSFYAQLPPELKIFMADLSEMFQGGIYDTKYIADFVARSPASYLVYIFRREQGANRDLCDSGHSHVRVTFPSCDGIDEVEFTPCGLVSTDEVGSADGKELCMSYAHHGYCTMQSDCTKSHNIDEVIKAGESKKKRQKKKILVEKISKRTDGEANVDTYSDKPSNYVNKPNISFSCHRAGFDAFMTGYSFASMLVQHCKDLPINPKSFDPCTINAEDIGNKLYLYGKDTPLRVMKSGYAKTSKCHQEKFLRITKSDKV